VVAQAGVPLVELNLGGAPQDPRLDHVRRAAEEAERLRDRVMAARSRA